MRDVGVEPVGVSPAPPDFEKIADAYAMAYARAATPGELSEALRRLAGTAPALIEYAVA